MSRLVFLVMIGIGLGVMNGCQNASQSADNQQQAANSSKNDTLDKEDYVMVIHGGAGGMNRENMSAEKAKIWKNKLRKALNRGYEILENGQPAVDAVETAIRTMENDSFFNAGKGSVFTHDGNNEMDASIMNGKNKNAGAMAGVSTIKNPISGARAVMEQSKHVMLARNGAQRFANQIGLDTVSPQYFFTQARYESHLKRLQQSKQDSLEGYNDAYSNIKKQNKLGTVGAVALDRNGNLAAGTSTGGMTNKKFGRIGDSPIIGAGTYADNNTCAVSATGHGEYFIRNSVAHDVSAMLEYTQVPLKKAAHQVIHDKLEALGGKGGIICVDQYGNIATPFNTSGMFRGFKKASGPSKVQIFKKDE